MHKKILVVGAVNVDIKGEISVKRVNPSSCHHGKIHHCLGGVAANMVINLSRLGSDVSLLTYVGLDDNGFFIAKKLSEFSVKVDNINFSSEFETGTYLAILDHQGIMKLSVADTRVLSLISKAFCERIWDSVFRDKDIVIVDSNILLSTSTYVLQRAKKEGKFTAMNIISAAAKKIEPLLPMLDFLSLNQFEAEEILGFKDPEGMALELNKRGVKHAAITLGKKGVFIAKDGKVTPLDAKKVEVVDTVGAGDAFLSGTICALSTGIDFVEAAKFGIDCSAAVVSIRENYLPENLANNLRLKMFTIDRQSQGETYERNHNSRSSRKRFP